MTRPPDTTKLDSERDDLAAAYRTVRDLRAALVDLEDALSPRRTRGGAGRAVSSDDLGLAAGERAAPMSSVARLSSISAGTIAINNVSVAIDPSVDSLDDVLARIGASGAGVTATLDADGRLGIEATDAKGDVGLTDHGTGFFAGVSIAERRYRHEPTAQVSVERAASAMKDFSRALSGLFANVEGKTPTSVVTRTRSDVLAATKKAFGGAAASELTTGFGVRLDFRSTAVKTFAFGARDEQSLRSALRTRPSAVTELFLGRRGTSAAPGLIESLQGALETAEKSLASAADYRGLLVDSAA